MGRRYLADPALATHDPLTHEPARRGASDRNRYVTSPAVPPGYADYAAGGAKHVPPPPLGHHALTARFQDAECLAGGRPAGASREEIAPKTARWAKETAYQIYADSETLDGSLSAAAEARRRSRGTTESSRRFAAPPLSHEPRVSLPRRHPSDASVLIEHRDGDFPGAYAPASEDVGKRFAPERSAERREAPETRRPFPPPRSVVRIGADGPPVSSIASATTDHYATGFRGGEDSARVVSGAGAPNAPRPGYDVITGAPAPRAPIVSGDASTEANRVRAKNGDPLLRMRPMRTPGSDPAAYDIVTGAARAATDASAYERPGAARTNPGLAATRAGSRRGFVERGDGDPAVRAGSLGGAVDTTPW